MDPRLPGLLRDLVWVVRPERFVLVGIAPHESVVALRVFGGLHGQFRQLIIEPEVTTLLVEEREWRGIAPAFSRARVEAPYRVISIPIDLPPDLTGFMAALASVLAEADVPILPIGAFTRDHIAIREADVPRAEAALTQLRGRG
jgi:hypothetical protein